jgi:hypothetical protein
MEPPSPRLRGRLLGFIKILIGITIIVWRFSMKIGELVYSGHMMEIGHMVLGIVMDIDRSGQFDDQGKETIYRVFWVDGGEPSWYYGNEVERIDATG